MPTYLNCYWHDNIGQFLSLRFIKNRTEIMLTTEPFICPVHTEVSSDQPGNCPKCGKKLVPRGSVDPKMKGISSDQNHAYSLHSNTQLS